MIILQKSNSNQNIDFIPREYTEGTSYSVKIYNETTNKNIYSSDVTSFTSNLYYYRHTDTFTLVEDTMYRLEIKDGNTTVYRDKIFCTNQTISSYSINNGQYTEHSQENEFIVL